MHRHAVRPRTPPVAVLSGIVGAALLAAACAVPGSARAEPPIASIEDAACRAEARAQVFTMPDPSNLGLHEIGRRLYYSCMRRLQRTASRGRQRRR